MDSFRPIWDVCVRLGLPVAEPVSLRSTNNTVVWLRPSPVVVKATPSSDNRLGWELAVATTLGDLGAPVVGPSQLVEPVVHHHDGWHMTFWTYHPQSEIALEPASVADALGRLHETLDVLLGDGSWRFPSWDETPRKVLDRLHDESYAPLLEGADRDLVRVTLARFGEVSALSARHGGLHGSPHAFNTLTAYGSVVFIDFETVCVGPREWDLCHADPAVGRAYPGAANAAALATAGLIVSAMTSALCWDGIDRGPDMRFHAEYHLARVRSALS